jgi:putrescine---pyruvate transaminase
MALSPAELVKADHEHLIHPLHHPIDNAEPIVYVRGRGAVVTDATGREYLDGLAGLWNVNVGHGRAELAEAAAEQIKEIAYFSAYTGSSNVPAITLASRLVGLAPNFAAVFFTSGGAESNESAFKTARFYWKAMGKPDKTKVIARVNAYHGVTLQAMSATGMGAYWKMFEPRVPGFVHIPTCSSRASRASSTFRRAIPTGRSIRSPARARARPLRAFSRKRSCTRGPIPWRRSSPSRSTAAAA